MPNQGIYIITGPIDSGKTSWCREFAAANPGCSGVLLAKVYRKGRRIGYDAVRLPAGQRIPFARLNDQQPSPWIGAQRVGPFSISAGGLQAANTWLSEAAAGGTDIVVDEIGPLELEGGGLSPGLRRVLDSPVRKNLYLVIRRGSVGPVCRRFGVGGYTLVDIAPGLEET